VLQAAATHYEGYQHCFYIKDAMGLFVWAAAFEKQLWLVGCEEAAVRSSC
jgi:hypothetical protein